MRSEGLKRGKEETFITAERGGDKPCDGASRLVRQRRKQRGRWLVIKPAHILRLEGQRCLTKSVRVQVIRPSQAGDPGRQQLVVEWEWMERPPRHDPGAYASVRSNSRRRSAGAW